MTRKEQFIKLVGDRKKELRELGISEFGLFGSVRRETDSVGSDLDLLVEFEPGMKTFDRLFTLRGILENELKCSVDLVTRRSLSPVLGPKILEEIEYVTITS